MEMWLLHLFVGSGAENWGKINEEGVISEGSTSCPYPVAAERIGDWHPQHILEIYS